MGDGCLSKLTPEQEKFLEQQTKKYREETLFICVKCKARLKGMNGVNVHVGEKQHYEYDSPETPGLRLGVV